MIISKIFLDMDGVICDLNKTLEIVFNTKNIFPGDIQPHAFWGELIKYPNFFLHLEPMPNYMELFSYLKNTGISLEILTSIPYSAGNLVTAREDKIAWVRKHLDEDIVVNTVIGGVKKAGFATDSSVLLIDDLPRNITAWENAGGTGILFKNNEDTIFKIENILVN